MPWAKEMTANTTERHVGSAGMGPAEVGSCRNRKPNTFSRRQDPVWIPSQLCYCNAASRLAQPCRRQQKCQVSFVTPVYRVMLGKCASSILLQVLLERKRYEWEDKYKPRKPRFFNRVKTGFEWNKYNQTHYDHDNPPPKIVQGRDLQTGQRLVLQKLVRFKCTFAFHGLLSGYKFNIFYPDLIDKSKAPTYHIERSDTQDTATSSEMQPADLPDPRRKTLGSYALLRLCSDSVLVPLTRM